jgi:hypothetical protein
MINLIALWRPITAQPLHIVIRQGGDHEAQRNPDT